MSGRTAILIVNGFDRSGRWGPFEEDEALSYPWIDLCLREVERRSKGSDYEILVWDNTHLPALREMARKHGAHLHPTDAEMADGGYDAPDPLVHIHAGSLLRLWSMVDDSFEFVMTLDTDAFPIRDGWIEGMKTLLDGASLTGIWRDEMAVTLAPFVHPSCLFIRRDRLQRMRDPFSLQGVQDVGQRITMEVLAAGENVAPLKRSNARNAHFLVGGIYGDLVYHHAAGSRFPVFRLTEGGERDQRVHGRLREAAFADVDHLVAVLRGESDDTLGLDWGAVAPVVSDARPGRRGVRAASGEDLAGRAHTAAWLDDLQPEMGAHAAILRRMLAAAEGDPRIRAMQVQGSVGRGEGDRHSDLDVGIVVTNSSWPAIADDVPALIRAAGEPVDEYYSFVPGGSKPELFKAWAQFPEGIQLDLLLLPDSRLLGSGPDGRALLDRDRQLLQTDHPMRLADPNEVVKWAFLSWQNLTEVAKYLERGRVVAAAEWLDSARQATISCWAAAHGSDYAGYANVASARFGVSMPTPAGLEKTYAPPEWNSVLTAAFALCEVQGRADAALQMRLAIPPRPLAAWVRTKLEQLRAEHPSPDSRQDRRSRRRLTAAAGRSRRRPPGPRPR